MQFAWNGMENKKNGKQISLGTASFAKRVNIEEFSTSSKLSAVGLLDGAKIRGFMVSMTLADDERAKAPIKLKWMM